MTWKLNTKAGSSFLPSCSHASLFQACNSMRSASSRVWIRCAGRHHLSHHGGCPELGHTDDFWVPHGSSDLWPLTDDESGCLSWHQGVPLFRRLQPLRLFQRFRRLRPFPPLLQLYKHKSGSQSFDMKWRGVYVWWCLMLFIWEAWQRTNMGMLWVRRIQCVKGASYVGPV